LAKQQICLMFAKALQEGNVIVGRQRPRGSVQLREGVGHVRRSSRKQRGKSQINSVGVRSGDRLATFPVNDF
jgi:hypothetical protein